MDRYQDMLDEIERLKASYAKAIDIMKEEFPRDSRVGFFIMAGQKNQSTGTVAGYTIRSGMPILQVLHDQAKSGSRYRYRDVDAREATRIES